jgi:hypothetical protein
MLTELFELTKYSFGTAFSKTNIYILKYNSWLKHINHLTLLSFVFHLRSE